MSSPHLLLVDLSNLLARAFYTLRERSLEGLPPKTRDMLSGAVRRWEATHLIVALDSPRSFRCDLLPGYKGDRAGRDGPSTADMTTALLPWLDAWGVATRRAEAMEADDVIATVVAQAKDNGAAVSILSKDTDLLQLVDDAARVRVLWPGGAEGEDVLGEAAVIERTGVRPGQLLDLRTMAGGKDNLPRIEIREGKPPYGFTEKRAVTLLSEGATLDSLYEGDAWRLTPREQGWLAACRTEALERRDALRLRTRCELIHNMGHSSAPRLQWDARPAPRCRCGEVLDDNARMFGDGETCSACQAAAKAPAKTAARVACAGGCGTVVSIEPYHDPTRAFCGVTCAVQTEGRGLMPERKEVV